MPRDVIKHPQTLTIDWYSRQAESTAKSSISDGRGALTYALLGLNGEAGECAEELKKAIREERDVNRELLLHELGDVAWYINRAAVAVGSSLEEVLLLNATKLAMRHGTAKEMVPNPFRGGNP